jgi:hypothetical protein
MQRDVVYLLDILEAAKLAVSDALSHALCMMRLFFLKHLQAKTTSSAAVLWRGGFGLTQIHDFPPKIAENVYVQKCDMINYNVLRLPKARKVVCSARK